jgi:hypothetical protein
MKWYSLSHISVTKYYPIYDNIIISIRFRELDYKILGIVKKSYLDA